MLDAAMLGQRAACVLAAAGSALALAYALGGKKNFVLVALEALRQYSPGYKPSVPIRQQPEERPDEETWERDPAASQIEVGRCRALLLEIIRRAAHDWVLYRNHRKPALLELAQDAHTWLFKEDEKHHWWRLRKESNQEFTAFLTICDLLDLEPEFVRGKVRKMTVQQIMSAGRPAERRKLTTDEVHYTEHDTGTSIEGLDPVDTRHMSSYEVHFAVSTPDYGYK